MAKAIYDELYALLSPPLCGFKPADLEKAKEGWQKLAYAISKGVINHITANMEIKGIHTWGDVIGSGVNVTGVTFTQSDDGKGHVA